MKIEIKESKNNLKTFLVDSVYYHSVYDPKKEAERFVQSITFDFSPSLLFLVESGFDYCSEFLQEKFPYTKIINLRIINNSLIPQKNDDIFFSDLYNSLLQFDAKDLINSQLLCWPTAQKVFPEEVKSIITDYKKALELSKTILITKQYFEKKWFKNSLLFLNNINNITSLKKIDKNILVIASGPSLEKTINFIKENQNKFIIFALSSAINPLIKNGILPDLCFSTDGGFWATKHLQPLIRNNIPLALAVEGAVAKDILKSNTIIPLVYNQGMASTLYKKTGLTYTQAESCPTVSETAIKLARDMTTQSVYILGLDLSTRKGFAHFQPNILEMDNSLKDSRINSLMTRISSSEISSKTSLNAYQTSFNFGKYDNCFRVVDELITTRTLSIKEINYKDFISIGKNIPNIEKKDIFNKTILITQSDKEKYGKIITEFVNSNCDSQEWKENLFPLDYTVLNHTQDDKKLAKQTEIDNKNKEYLQKIRTLING